MANGNDPNDPVELTRQTLIQFCKEFISHPYLCYTEHGLHALFFSKVYCALPEEIRYADCNGQRVCVIQKEYPTAHKFEKSRRQHWDFSVIKCPAVAPCRPNGFDFLPLSAVVEFGLNCSLKHLKEDIRRLSHAQANVGRRIAVHLYRISTASDKVSRRDLGPKSKKICTRVAVRAALRNCAVEVFYGLADAAGANLSELWLITENGEERL